MDPLPDLPLPIHESPQGVVAVLARNRTLKYHEYDLAPPTPHLDELIEEVKRDRTGIFWG